LPWKSWDIFLKTGRGGGFGKKKKKKRKKDQGRRRGVLDRNQLRGGRNCSKRKCKSRGGAKLHVSHGAVGGNQRFQGITEKGETCPTVEKKSRPGQGVRRGDGAGRGVPGNGADYTRQRVGGGEETKSAFPRLGEKLGRKNWILHDVSGRTKERHDLKSRRAGVVLLF